MEYLIKINNFIWGAPLIVLIMSVGIYLTVKLRFIQITKLPLALKYMLKNEKGGCGEVSSFSALCTSLAATIGTGNIIGVATAITSGGPGALFWMWVAAIFGMATKYAESFLAIKYRKINKDGHIIGGPFYYIEKGMGKSYIWLAKLFAFFGAVAGLLGIGTITQINGITSAVADYFDPNKINTVSILGNEYTFATVISGFIVTALSALVIIGGIKRIAKVSSFVVPFMSVFYILFTVIILMVNYEKIPYALSVIIKSAFKNSAIGGGMVGFTVKNAIQKGVSRGVFTNEAGLGSAPIASAAAKTKDTVRQGLVSMTGTFIDTVVLCTMTGLAIVITNAFDPALGLEGVSVTAYAYSKGLPFPEEVSRFSLMLFLIFFAFSTIIGWNYYGEKCVEYLFKNKKAVNNYRLLYILSVFIGPYLTVEGVFLIADISNALMALPNLIALVALSRVVERETNL